VDKTSVDTPCPDEASPSCPPLFMFPVKVWLSVSILTIVVFMILVLYSLHETGGRLASPFDDSYIHYQFARRLAGGHFFSYSPGGSYSTAATSFTYPFFLSAGYLVGFRGDAIVIWALVLALFFSAHSSLLMGRLLLHMDYYLCPQSRGRFADLTKNLPLLTAAFLLTSGNMAFLLASGMEVALTIWLLLLFLNGLFDWMAAGGGKTPLWPIRLIIVTVILCLTRPEGLIMVAIAFVLIFVRSLRGAGRFPWKALVPVLLVMACYMGFNAVKTGYPYVTGMRAKSLFYDAGIGGFFEALVTGLTNYSSFWFGRPPMLQPGLHPIYCFGNASHLFLPGLPGLFLPFCLIGAVIVLLPDLRKRTPGFGTICLAGLIFVSLSTMFNRLVFTHALRYQGILWPLVMIFIGATFLKAAHLLEEKTGSFRAVGIGLFLLVGLNAIRFPDFVEFYGRACQGIRMHHIRMAEWAEKNLPPGEKIGVHDLGAIAYYTDRPVLDVYGLGSPDYQRPLQTGNPSILEQFEHEKDPPKYFVGRRPWLSYDGVTNGRETVLASSRLPHKAPLGTDRMSVFEVKWDILGTGGAPVRYEETRDFEMAADVDVADTGREEASKYRSIWKPYSFRPRSISRILPVRDAESRIPVFDSGRLVPLEETFTLTGLDSSSDLILIGRYWVPEETGVTLFANGEEYPSVILEGDEKTFQEIRWTIGKETIRPVTTFRVVPRSREFPVSCHFWAFQEKR